MSLKDVKKEYNKLARVYDTKWKGYLNSTHKKALKLLHPSKKDVVLEVSGGTGLFTSKYVKKVKRVSMIDISPEMLKIAKKRLKDYKNVKINLGSADSLKFKSYSFDKVVNNSAFHHYDKPNKVILEFNRVLKLKGKLIIIDWCNNPLYFKLFDLFLKLFHKSYVGSYTTKEITNLLVKNNFKIEKIVRWNLGLWSLMGIRAKKLK